MNSSKARLFVTFFGRNGARIVYIVLGVLLVILGIGITLGVIRDVPRR